LGGGGGVDSHSQGVCGGGGWLAGWLREGRCSSGAVTSAMPAWRRCWLCCCGQHRAQAAAAAAAAAAAMGEGYPRVAGRLPRCR
jgi:hypothetical protein